MRRGAGAGRVTASKARRRRFRRPWYRTRAYRLTRTIVVAGSLLAAVVCWDRGGEPGRAATALPPSPAAGAAALPGGSTGAPARPSPSHATGPHTGTPTAPTSRTAATTARGPETPGSRPSKPPPVAGPEANDAAAPTARSPRPLPPSRATRLLIPHLSLDAPVEDLGLDRDHRLTAPPENEPELVGWYRHGAPPGGQGTAVAVGHLDTDRGPAVFAGLTELEPGSIVQVRRADARTAVYTVDRIKKYEKANFPSQEVYGARDRPELRLITCTGTYDRRKGYSGNLVVFAHLTGTQ
ncbi:class F sortase [Streptomyces djakartensis]|uniref:class F sortase n=1 Tax=Streptomyces djakartensis TaxID=68193 RepID=UPI001E431760|nr:class F sortase [Streptomyces djakartensis]